jgi:hypothetical protein
VLGLRCGVDLARMCGRARFKTEGECIRQSLKVPMEKESGRAVSKGTTGASRQSSVTSGTGGDSKLWVSGCRDGGEGMPGWRIDVHERTNRPAGEESRSHNVGCGRGSSGGSRHGLPPLGKRKKIIGA